jgi:hypothetical protein
MANDEIIEEQEVEAVEGARKKLVEGLLQVLGLEGMLTYSRVAQNTFFVIFLLGLGVFHVFNTHSAERMVRNMAKKEKEIKELRWEYMSVKSDLMFKSKRSELEKELEIYGLKPLSQPPYKIVVKQNEY